MISVIRIMFSPLGFRLWTFRLRGFYWLVGRRTVGFVFGTPSRLNLPP